MTDTDNDIFDLDEDLSQVEDLAQFMNPCDGTHIVGIIFAGEDKVGDKRGIKVVYQLIETIEKAKPDEPCTAPGSMFSEVFTGADMGRKLLKVRVKQIFGDEISGAFRPYIEALGKQFRGEYLVKMTTKIVHNKAKKGSDNEGQVYENLRIMDASSVQATLPEGHVWQEYTPRDSE